jgi:tetratricopeptide (TPR) repeat protein
MVLSSMAWRPLVTAGNSCNKNKTSANIILFKMKRLLTLIFLACLGVMAMGQNPKKIYSLGVKQLSANNYTEAIQQFTEAIRLDPQMANAYLMRAKAYNKNKQPEEALNDFRKLSSFKMKDKSYCLEAGQICYEQGLFAEGLPYAEQVILINKMKYDGVLLKSKLQMANGDYPGAVAAINLAIAMQDKSEHHYFKAQALEKLGLDAEAEKEYLAAIAIKQGDIVSLNALARLQLRIDKGDLAMANCNRVIAIDTNNKEAYLTRAAVYVKKLDYPLAINDMSRTIMLNPNDAQLYLIRGTYYQEFTQHQNAINDFNKLLLLDDKNTEAYYKRAYSYEQIANYPMAVKDYRKLTEVSQFDGKAQELLKLANERLFELNRESVKPQIVLKSPVAINNNTVNVPFNAQVLTLSGQIVDDSDIKSLKVNFVDVTFEIIQGGTNFTAQVNVASADTFYVTATDVYDNKREEIYTIRRTEIDAPKVALLAPYATDNGEIFLDMDTPNLYVEGQVSDQSLISSIMIDGVLASFAVEEMNPRFMATVPINNKEAFTVIAKDVYGNTSEQRFSINRQGAGLLERNPMGRTWAVFIENSSYDKFPTLDGPSRDVSLMRSALSGYDIHNIIHKKNMSKSEMERFFAIELRDLIKANNVRSVMIWYAGHGKFVNETGYWIPTDATVMMSSAITASMR